MLQVLIEQSNEAPYVGVDSYRWQRQNHQTVAARLLEEPCLMEEENASEEPSDVGQMCHEDNYYLTTREPIFIVQKLASIAARPPARRLDENLVAHSLHQENVAFPHAWHATKSRVETTMLQRYYVDGIKHYLEWSRAFWGNNNERVALPKLAGKVYCCCCNDLQDEDDIEEHIVGCAAEELRQQNNIVCMCGDPHGPYHACGMAHAVTFFRVLTINEGIFQMDDARRVYDIVLARPLLLAKFYATSYMDKRKRTLEQISHWYMMQEEQPKFLLDGIHGTLQFVINQGDITLPCKYCDKFLTRYMPILQQTLFGTFGLETAQCPMCEGPSYKYQTTNRHFAPTEAMPSVIIPLEILDQDVDTSNAAINVEGHSNVQYLLSQIIQVDGTEPDLALPMCRASMSEEAKMHFNPRRLGFYDSWRSDRPRRVYTATTVRGRHRSQVGRQIPYQMLADGKMLKLCRSIHYQEAPKQKIIPPRGNDKYDKWKIAVNDGDIYYVMADVPARQIEDDLGSLLAAPSLGRLDNGYSPNGGLW